MKEITYDCPNCYTHYVLWDGIKPMDVQKQNDLSEYVRKQYDEVGSCKFCVRKYPNVPTTAEMDGLLTVEDMRNRFRVVMQCKACKKWTEMKRPDAMEIEEVPCSGMVNGVVPFKGEGCGKTDYDSTSMKSYRTYNPATDNKRKPKG